LRRRLARLAACLAAFCLIPAAGAQTFVDPSFSSEPVVALDQYKPVALAWTPDGDMLILQRDGIVRVFANGQLLPTPFLDFSGKVNTYLDRGMLGIAVHPGFEENGYVYLTYVYEPTGNPADAGPKLGRLVRVRADPSNHHVMLAGSETVLIGDLPSSFAAHSTGAVRFAPDGTLFFGNGDGSPPSRQQAGSLEALSIDSYRGKLLRVRDDGTAPGDNPFDDGTNSIRSKVWAYGLRNPFRFAFHPITGEPFIGDVGWDTWEEIDHGPAGSNFGWPCYEGPDPQEYYTVDFPSTCSLYPPSAITAPVFTYSHADLPPIPQEIVAGDSITAGTFYTGQVYPSTYDGNFFFADYVGGWIMRLEVDAAGQMTGIEPFASGINSPVAVEMGPDGLLYYVSFVSGEVRRIRRLGGPTAVASASPTYGLSPLSVVFSSSGSTPGPGGTYLWEFGDGVTSTVANPSHTYVSTTVKTYDARLTVTDASTSSSTVHVPITINSRPPTPQIGNPPTGTSVLPGQAVNFSGSAFDQEDGFLSKSKFTWTILLHHDTHVHTVLMTTGTYSGMFQAEYHGTGTYSYEIELRVVDSSGLTSVVSRAVTLLPDTTAPSAPGSLSAVSVGLGRVDLAWVKSTDLGGVADYHVERCQGSGCTSFAELTTTATPSFADGGLAPSAVYRYRVRAADTSGNLGPYSAVAQATTQAGSSPAGLVAAYSFDEGLGTTAYDTTGHGHDGTVVGASWTAGGKNGGCLEFGGGGDLVRVDASSALDFTAAATLEAWVYPTTSLSGWSSVIQHAVDDYFLHASNSTGAMRPAVGITTGGQIRWISATSTIPVGAWTHLALSYGNGSLQLYVNGALAVSSTQSGGITATSNQVTIGGNVPYGEYFKGRIDDVRLYSRVLAASEIQADMAAAAAPAGSAPPAVPDGRVGARMSVGKNNPAGSSLLVTWDEATCSGPYGHRLIYGGGSQLPTSTASVLGVGGAACAVSSPFLWSAPPTTIDPTGLVWWVIVASDASGIEGSWGTNGLGEERNGPGPGGSSGSCGTPGKSLSNTCGR
jgi:glucose/arabinose dehydrogenase